MSGIRAELDDLNRTVGSGAEFDPRELEVVDRVQRLWLGKVGES